MKKVFAALVIAFVSIVLMSHNTFAFDVNTLVGLPSQVGFTSMNCNAGVTCNSATNQGVFNQINVTFYTENSQVATLVAGRYVEFNVYLFKLTDGASMHAVLAGLTTSLSSNVKILSAHFETLDTNTGVIRIVGYVMNNTSTATLTFGSGSLVLRSSEEVRPGTWTEWQRQNISVDVDIDEQAIVNAIEQSAREQSEQRDQEQAALDNAVEDSQNAGQDSSDAATAGTGSLISAIGSAVAAITSASPTNCLINGNMGNLNVGQIDLCANPVPSFVTIIGSLLLVLFIVPLCISLFNRFINLFRSFQS